MERRWSKVNIQAGDIIFIKGKHPIVSRLVRFFTQSEYTHVGIAVSKDLIFEIDMNKRMAIHPFTYKEFDVYRYKGGLSLEQKKNMQHYAINKAKENTGYDWSRIFSFAMERFFAFPFSLDHIHKEVCSEIVDLVYRAAEIDLVPSRPLGDARPSDLAASPVLEIVASISLESI